MPKVGAISIRVVPWILKSDQQDSTGVNSGNRIDTHWTILEYFIPNQIRSNKESGISLRSVLDIRPIVPELLGPLGGLSELIWHLDSFLEEYSISHLCPIPSIYNQTVCIRMATGWILKPISLLIDQCPHSISYQVFEYHLYHVLFSIKIPLTLCCNPTHVFDLFKNVNSFRAMTISQMIIATIAWVTTIA